MYECGMRLGTEVFTPEGLQRQAKCYLACLNCLKLVINYTSRFFVLFLKTFVTSKVNEKYSWIVKPVANSLYVPQGLPPGASPRRNADGEELERTARERPKMEVLEMEDIEKEFELVCSRLKLARK